MHELSIAMSIVELAQEEAETRGCRIRAIYLKLGDLCGVVKEALLGSYEIASAGTPLEGSRLVIEPVPIVVLCPVCQQPRPIRSIQLFQCPECGALTAQILEGGELLVTGLEVDP